MTKHPFWKTYVAVGVAAALGAYLWFVERKREIKPDGPAKEKVFALDKSKVEELTVSSPGAEEVRVVKEGDGWRLAAPLQAAADKSEVDALVSSLESLEMEEVVAETPGDLGQFGLTDPRTAVGVRVQGATDAVKLLVGEKTPDGGALYAKLAALPRVFTISSYLEGTLAKKPSDLRDRDVLHVKRDAVKTVAVTGPQGSYALARDERGEWGFTEPFPTRAGRWSVDGLLGTLENLRFDSVAAEQAAALEKFGLASPARTVTLGLNEGGAKTLEIGARVAGEDNKYYARERASALVAVVPGAVVDDLAKGMGELRAKRLLEVATYETQGIEVLQDGVTRKYERSSSKDQDGVDVYKWKRTAPDAKDLDTNTVQDALFALGGVEATEFIDRPAGLEAYGLDRPALKVTLTYEGGNRPPAWIEIGRKDGAAHARRAGDDSILKIDPAKADEILKSFGGL
ncbi:MAG TPA: DUF4340 domain-containing protein [Vicinamibacteria bacterium]|nr:DUF4340 domain-containing protein [Vicinamibacteria bacterium]